MSRYVGSPQHREHWSHVTTAIRTGRPVVPEMRGKPLFEYLSEEKNRRKFQWSDDELLRVGDPIGNRRLDFSPYATIVDVAGGRGRLLAAI